MRSFWVGVSTTVAGRLVLMFEFNSEGHPLG
jgi:hypothetical protein